MTNKWFDILEKACTPEPGKCNKVLVLCRTGAMAESVRRRIALRGALLGVEVTTPLGMATVRWEVPLDYAKSNGEPPPTELVKKIGERTGLLEHARDWAKTVRLHLAAGGSDDGLPEALVELARTDWGRDEEEDALKWMLENAGGLDFDAVFAVGYHPSDAGVPAAEAAFLQQWLPRYMGETLIPMTNWERGLLEALHARPLAASFGALSCIPAVQVPDVAAECRLATRLLLEEESLEDCLVLVPDQATAQRLAAACRRNGVAAAPTERMALARHPLCAVLSTALSWFSGVEDPPIRAAHLGQVLTNRLVKNGFPSAIEKDLRKRIAGLDWSKTPYAPESDRFLHLNRHQITRGIAAARIIEAPLSVWIARFEHLAALDDAPEYNRRAMVLEARLRRLREWTVGVKEDGESAPPGDAQEDVATLADDRPEDPEERIPDSDAPEDGPGTLGAMRRFILECGVAGKKDPVTMALLAALRENASSQAEPAQLQAALSGSASSGLLLKGVEILTYDDYDFRVASRLLLLGVHNKGLALPPTPDPLADSDQQWVRGVAGGDLAVKFRALQAIRAAQRAGQCLAIVTERDSSGRAVVPPIELPLDFEEGKLLLRGKMLVAETICNDNHGAEIPGLPETTSRTLVRAFPEAPEHKPEPPDVDDPVLQHLLMQAWAEWFRAARGPGGNTPTAAPDESALSELLDDRGSPAPEWVMPWLGGIGPLPEALLDPEEEWSVSRHFEPLTQCLYKMFGTVCLGLSPPEEVSDELDPKEIGNAVHTAFENRGQDVPWRFDEEKVSVDAARDKGLRLLRNAVGDQFETAIESMGHRTDALESAARGTGKRWDTYLEQYVKTRLKPLSACEATGRKMHSELLWSHDAYIDLREELEKQWQECPSAPDSVAPSRRDLWLKWCLEQTWDGVELSGLTPEDIARGKVTGRPKFTKSISGGDPGAEALLASFVASGRFLDVSRQLQEFGDELRILTSALSSTYSAIRAELGFGKDADPGSNDEAGDVHLELTLQGKPLKVRGKIDRVAVLEGDGPPLLEILDYKTGNWAPRKPSDVEKHIDSLETPQLVVYALALRRLLADKRKLAGIPANAGVGTVGYDYVRKETGLTNNVLMLDPKLDHLAALLQHHLDRVETGQWLLSPRPKKCPALSERVSKKLCPFAWACRLEELPEIGEPDDEGGDA